MSERQPDGVDVQVEARPWARGYELHIDGYGVTQSHSLDDAEMMVRDYMALEGVVVGEVTIVHGGDR